VTVRRTLFALRRDSAGATLVEFAMLLPVLLMTLMGLFDLAYNMYTSSMLNGSIQKVARDSTIEGASTGSLDANVTKAVKAIVPGATLTFTRKSYSSFTKVGRAEDYTDVNKDGVCNANEPYEDANGNGSWDSDVGLAGQGGARDAVLYTVKVTYQRAFPVASFVGLSNTFTTSSSMVLRNQPYGLQNQVTSTMGNCI
jgi:Flp pilus assembly protein TadG